MATIVYDTLFPRCDPALSYVGISLGLLLIFIAINLLLETHKKIGGIIPVTIYGVFQVCSWIICFLVLSSICMWSFTVGWIYSIIITLVLLFILCSFMGVTFLFRKK
jgi:hypothetical protein